MTGLILQPVLIGSQIGTLFVYLLQSGIKETDSHVHAI